MFGLLERDIEHIVEVCSLFPDVEKALLFGSRAMGNYKQTSDIDIALVGENLTTSDKNKIVFELEEERPIPYFFDIISYHTISNSKLKAHIDEHGKVLYSR